MRQLFTLLLTLCALLTHAQTQSPRLVKTQGTGPYANVHSGICDKEGNLWFATTGEGVYRYDGKLFTNYTVKDGLCSNGIYAVLQDNDGNIWFGGDNAICRYDGRTFTNIPLTVVHSAYVPVATNAAPAIKISIQSMLQDKAGKIWVGTNQGVYCYSNNQFTRFLQNDNVQNPNKLRLLHVQSILQDKAGNTWFTTWFEGLCRYDGKTITNFKPNNEVWYAGLAEDHDGNIWIGRRDKGVVRYDGRTFTNIRQHGLFDTCGISNIITDKAGNIWFATESGELVQRDEIGGIWRYDGKSFKNLTMKDGLPNHSAFSIVEDRSGNLWFGTRGMGLCRYDGRTITTFSN